MVIDGNDGSHRYGGGYDCMSEGAPASNRVRTEGRPERIILRRPIFCKHEITETPIVDLIFLDQMVINGDVTQGMTKLTSLYARIASESCCSSIAENLPFLYTNPVADGGH
jgi:hypothetical protein